MKTSIYFLFILTIMSACHPNGIEATSANSPKNQSSAQYLKLAFERGDLNSLMKINLHGKTLEQADYISLVTKMYNSGALVVPVIKGDKRAENAIGPLWRDKDAKIRSFLNENKEDPNYSYLRQFCALDVIRKTELLTDNSDDALSTLGYYIDILAQEQNISPAFFYQGLKKLKNYWPKQQLKSTVELAIKASEEAMRQNQQGIQNFEKGVKKGHPELLKSAFYADQIDASKEIDRQYLFYIKQMKAMILSNVVY
ncbi:hypothetical protein [Runella zeae]|uniref:hypothetical protein n=1 Tax=Runella zeae TaxID=94255 RepID=UPI0023548A6B|nr:hypothetical protein [Runella zeae]